VKKTRKKIWLFILITILILAVAGGGAYFYLQTKLKVDGDSAKTEVVNAMIKEMVTHPTEIKEMMNSITITDRGASASSDGKETSASSVKKSAPTPSSSSPAAPVKSKTASDSSSISSLKYMKAHYTEYELLSTSAKNLGGNTYRLTATVRHKLTGKINTVEVATQLSESMKETLRNYRK
jgi:flagellar basal body-associated protein FliL